MPQMVELPRYRCHKIVRAGIIVAIDVPVLTVDPGGKRPAQKYRMPPDWFYKHKPAVGGYFVNYDDGQYFSYSPATVFERGYALIDDNYKPLAPAIAPDQSM